jgi:hypothetical protein
MRSLITIAIKISHELKHENEVFSVNAGRCRKRMQEHNILKIKQTLSCLMIPRRFCE